MQKEIRLKCTDAVADAADLAAERLGLTTTAYTRMALIERTSTRNSATPSNWRIMSSRAEG